MALADCKGIQIWRSILEHSMERIVWSMEDVPCLIPAIIRILEVHGAIP